MIDIRTATTEDAAAIAALLGELGYQLNTEEAAARLARLAATGHDPVLLAISNDAAVGLLALHRTAMLNYAAPVMRVVALVVAAAARRAGIGRHLIGAAFREAAASGCGFVELTSANHRKAAHAFYHSLGFEASSLRFRKAVPA